MNKAKKVSSPEVQKELQDLLQVIAQTISAFEEENNTIAMRDDLSFLQQSQSKIQQASAYNEKAREFLEFHKQNPALTEDELDTLQKQLLELKRITSVNMELLEKRKTKS